MQTNRALREWAGVGVALLLILASAAHGEVLPTRRAPQFFTDRSFSTPSNWQVRSLPTGQTFHLAVYYSSFKATIETEDGPKPFSQMHWAKDAIVRVRAHELRDPAVFEDLLENKTNPIMFFGEGAYMEPFMYPGRTRGQVDDYAAFVLKTKEAFGPRFLCIDYCEWTWGGVSRGKPTRELSLSCDILKLPLPADRDTAAAWFDQRYDLVFKRYQDAGIPVFSQNCTTLNHYEARKGTFYTGNAIAYINPAHDSTFMAFCRGASRQFDIAWGSYAAGFGGHSGHSNFRSKSPDVRIRRGGLLRGAYTAVPLQEQRRTLYSVYMAGGNFLVKESDSGQGMLAGYNPLTIDRTDPRIVALADTKQYAGPYALMCSEFYDNIVKKHDRGTPYTPIALMFDKNHGLAFKYSQVLAVGAVPYTTADEQMRAVINTVFPYETSAPPHVAADYRAGPFGEIFDVVTTEASAPTINSYRAIVLVGQARVDARLGGILRQFVEKGGLLFMVCEQMTPELWSLAGIADTGELAQDSSYLRASDFYVYNQDVFDYHKVTLAGAEPLFVAGKYEERSWPVATINRVGDGCVIVGMPVWLNTNGDPTRMHSLFSEIMGMIADELAPVRVYGSEVKVMVNRNAAGWVVTLMNNRGHTIAYPGYRPAERESDAAGVVLTPRFEYSEATEWLTGATLDEGRGSGVISRLVRSLGGGGRPGADGAEVALIVPPGGIRIVEFRGVPAAMGTE